MAVIADPELPGLGATLDAQPFLESLRKALHAQGEEWEVVGGRIADVQYRPGSSCVVLFRLRFRHPASGRTTRRFVWVDVLRSDAEPPSVMPDLAARYEAYRRRVVRTPSLYLHDAHAAVFQFPVDPTLPWLFDAVDSRVVKRHLSRALAHRNLRVLRVASRMLGYTPQSRATMLYDVVTEDKETGAREERRLVGKTHFRKPPDRLFANAWALARTANGTVGLAEPVGYSARLRMTLQEQVEGRRLADFAGSPPFIPLMRETARSIAAVHALSLPLRRRRGPEDEARIVNRWADVVAALCPDLDARVQRLRDRLISRLEESAVPAGTVHGDFHPGNVLANEGGVTLIDLDEVAISDPLLDVGRFLASLRVSAMRVFADASGLAHAEDAFLREYLTRAPGEEARARLFEAASLLIAAAAPFRLQRAGWREAAARLVHEAETVVMQGAGAPRAPSIPKERPRTPRKERLRWVTDGVYMQAVLDPYIRDAYGADVMRCRVRGVHETEHGHRLSYSVAGWRRDEKWRVSLAGLMWRAGSGRRLGNDLAALGAVVDGDPRAPRVPVPVAYLSQFSLLVLERPRGERFSSLIGTAQGLETASRVAEALLALREARPAIETTRSISDELGALRTALDALDRARPELRSEARSLLANVETALTATPARTSPIVAALHPDNILASDGRIAIEHVDDVVLAHPLLDAGAFLASLTLKGFEDEREADAAEIAERFRREYVAGSGATAPEMAGFEAAMLLRSACAVAVSDGATAERVVSRAAATLAAV